MPRYKHAEQIAAAEAGERQYSTGRPCHKGHHGNRYTSNGICITCNKDPAWLKSRNEYYHRRKLEPEWYAAMKAKSSARSRIRYKHPTPTRLMPDNCECCGAAPNGASALHLDHDHITGKFRGWLCMGCNTSIGKLGDNIEGVQRALDYLNGKITS